MNTIQCFFLTLYVSLAQCSQNNDWWPTKALIYGIDKNLKNTENNIAFEHDYDHSNPLMNIIGAIIDLGDRENNSWNSFKDLHWLYERKFVITEYIAYLFYDQLSKVKKDCFFLRLVCNRINKEYGIKVHRTILESIIDIKLFKADNAYDRIQKTILQNDYYLEDKEQFVPIQKKIQSIAWLKNSDELHTIVSPEFWQKKPKIILYKLQKIRKQDRI